MSDIGEKARINIIWKVSPYDYSKDKEKRLITKASRKYNVPRERISISPDFIIVDEKGKTLNFTTDIVNNIQDPKFQLKLFKEFIELEKIEGYDFELIKKIDAEINEKIDYQIYDKYRRYAIKWIKWDNFLSYGANNIFDFRDLRGLVLLNGDNQSGKTTFAIDLISFLLFGKTDKVSTQDKIFNKHMPEATKVEVEGCLNIDGEDYVIKRTLSRPKLSARTEKSKTTQKVEYYKIVGESREELVEYVENQQEENTVKTNKKIKEAIGREDDFELVMSVTETNLDSLIKKKDAERGRLLSRWIGLMPLESKDMLAREHFNQFVKPHLNLNLYDKESLQQEIVAFKTCIKDLEKKNKEFAKENRNIDNDLSLLESNKKTLLLSKQNIDNNVLKVDITTLKNQISVITEEGKKKKTESNEIDAKLKEIGNIEFSANEYDTIVEEINGYKSSKGILGEQFKTISNNISHLKTSEYCPTCGKKFDNVDNSKKIAELEKELSSVTEEGKKMASKISEGNKKIQEMKEVRDKYELKNKLSVQKTALDLNISNLRNKLIEMLGIKKEYERNSDAIDKNNNIDIEINNTDTRISALRLNKERNITYITENISTLKKYHSDVDDREKMIKTLESEEILVKNWKIYLKMVGKDGISKMVLRKTLPLINARLSQVLFDVCDFDVRIDINNKNEIAFNLIKDGILSDLSSGSGFERTCASLALRFVLSDISTVPRANFVLLDEILGRVKENNLENIHRLLEKIIKQYDFMLHVCHIRECEDWSNQTITINKVDNISHIKLEQSAIR